LNIHDVFDLLDLHCVKNIFPTDSLHNMHKYEDAKLAVYLER